MDKSKIFAIVLFVFVFIGIGAFILVKYLTDSGDEPLLDFFPKPDKDENPDSSLIWTNRHDESNKSTWGDQLTSLIKEYSNTSNWKGSGKICSFENGQQSTDDEHCWVKVDQIQYFLDRTPENNFGYTGGIGKPCVLLKLKGREGWIPEPYTEKDLDEAKESGMPIYLQERIRSLGTNPLEFVKQKMNTIWVTCEGIDPSDKENIGPTRFYSPGMASENFPGIPGYYFPYLKQRGYQTPFVIVQFENLQVNVLVNVECRAWAKNIGTDDQKGFAKVQFELLLD